MSCRAALFATLSLLVLAGAIGCRGTPEDHEASVRALLAEGRVDESLERLRGLLDADPEQPALQILYAEILMRRGDYQLAIWPLRRATEVDELAVPAGAALARAYAATGSFEDAVAAASKVLDREPDHRLALDVRAQSLLSAKREPEALDDIERLIELDRDAVGPRILKLRALLTLEREEEAETALAELRKTMGRTEAASELQARYCGVEAVFTRERGEAEEAVRIFDDCLERYPADTALLQEALSYYPEQGRGAELVPLLRRALEVEPRNQVVREGLAALHQERGEGAEAERVLIEGTELPESGSAAWFGLYEHYWRTEEWRKARNAIARALEATPELSTTHALLYADALLQNGEYALAEAIARELEPGYRELLLGRSRFEQGDPAGALPLLEESFRRWPGNATARWLAGRCHEQLGEIDAALEQYIEAFRNEESQKLSVRTDAALRIARIQMAAGAPEAAISFVSNYIGNSPGDPRGYEVGAEVFARAGRAPQLAAALQGLEALPGQRGNARARQAQQISERRDAAAAADFVEASGIDLLAPENSALLDVHLDHLVASQRSEEAVTLTNDAVSAQPERADLHALRGRTLAQTGAPDAEVRAAFERALAIEPQQVEALEGQARLAERGRDVDEAIAFYDRAAAADPSTPEAALAAARLVAARPDQGSEARERLERLLRDHALCSEGVILLSRLVLAEGRELERAESLARRGARFGGDPARVMEAAELMGWIQLQRGDANSAVETLERVVEQNPESASARFRLGAALAAAGRREEGERALREALAAGEFEETEQAREILAGLEPAAREDTP